MSKGSFRAAEYCICYRREPSWGCEGGKKWAVSSQQSAISSQQSAAMDPRLKPVNQEQPTIQQEQPAVQQEQPAVQQEQPAVQQEQPAVQQEQSVQFRVIVVGIVQNESGEYLICKMPKGRGVFPDQWGLPGGGIEEGEMMEAALRRELKEELGIEISDIKPLFFTDGQYKKSFSDGTQREVYMIFLIFSCRTTSNQLVLAPEFSDYAWVRQESLMNYELNSATISTFRQTSIIR